MYCKLKAIFKSRSGRTWKPLPLFGQNSR
jgi:hypothetical protein